MTERHREVDELRQEIARLDAQLLVELDKRARTARQLREARKDQGPSLPFTDHTAIPALVARSNGDMPREALRDIFREVFAACLALELPVRVAYVGPEGGARHAAARGRFGRTPSLLATDTTVGALDEVTRRRAEFAVVPFETASDGPVKSTILALMSSDLRVVEVLDATYELHLMNRSGSSTDVQKIYTTPADHAQCQRFLEAQYPRPSVLDVNTPLMACELAVEDVGAAAITNETFGAEVGLQVTRRNVLDNGGVRVRYAVVGSRPSGRTGNDATSLVFSVRDAPGSLLDVLRVFAERGLNLSNIQSYPVEGQPWQYLFYVDLVGHLTDRPLVMALEELKRITRFLKVLGSYPAP